MWNLVSSLSGWVLTEKQGSRAETRQQEVSFSEVEGLWGELRHGFGQRQTVAFRIMRWPLNPLKEFGRNKRVWEEG